ncbi:7-cyano-7-deazaguanosine (preQ0) biosynthesis protein QueE [Nocardiopsis sp. Huas11]|uniref:7-carboxy-7-deazaguanine synthase QueE n=1 Tax=Nocardiopsis sp. Huas11 TaxID=2183912 RepID=UPI000F1B0D85|nr:7-carboxy-7-deazaguanine synthase QueE [Nocardiopsis sp. Huas11]RKS07041.1 7-cyano-7-deazaguanosine (preQ0) biosynthesis protein QueE [Nocardiopsis sp. Huas11]
MNLLLSPTFDGPDLVVSEVFGPTVQGEGPNCGRRAVFVRLADCNLACSWCDTPYSWKWNEYVRREETYRCNAEEVLDRARSSGVGLVVVTGGEPLLQKALEPLVATLTDGGLDVEVETNGTRLPSPDLLFRARFNVSPKLANAGVPQRRRIRAGVLRALARSGNAVFKFVVQRSEELDEVADLVERCRLAPVWIMPQGTSAEEVLAHQSALADEVIKRGWNLSTRLHVLLWGDQRGR